MNGTFTGVIDRIVDGETAVILIEDDGEVVDEYNLSVENIPSKSDEGAVLQVRIEDGEIVQMDYLDKKTESRRQAAQDKFDRLSERLSDS